MDLSLDEVKTLSRPKLTPTPEQLAILQKAKTTQSNILITALAGGAKTSTLQMVCETLTGSPILSLAFNKKIAEEMAARLPSHVSASTINSLGHRAWSSFTGKKLTVDTRKSYQLLKDAVDGLKGNAKSDAYDVFSDTLNAISRAKLNGYLPVDKFLDKPHPLSREDFILSFDEPPSAPQMRLIDDILVKTVKQGFDGRIDFDDQIFLPTIFGGVFPKFPLNLVDEAQDLSALNLVFLSKLVESRRIIAVGDRHQSIYAFRGAATNSMDQLKAQFSMEEMSLSISFRCPQSVVRKARSHAPNMQWRDGAPEGSIDHLDHWSASDIPDGAAIICRNNAPLLSCALALLRAGRGVKLVGTDLGPSLIKPLKKLGPDTMNQAAVLLEIDKWKEAKLRTSRAKASIEDKAECLRVFANFGETLAQAVAYAEHLFASSGPILLMSGHKSKGLEFDTVFHLDSWRVPSKYAETDEELLQEDNLDYVITTRAKDRLVYISLEDFIE